jgi:hypothetical protein
MGMFDYINFNGIRYQTKEFTREMSEYYIENHRLLKSIGHFEEVPKNERPYPNAKEGSIEELCGSIKWIEESKEDLNYHGIVGIQYGNKRVLGRAEKVY